MLRIILSLTILLTTFTMTFAQEKKETEMKAKAESIISKMTVDEKISQLMNRTPGIERLGLKPYDWWNECLHGVGRSGRATSFPMPIGLGATFNPSLVEEIGNAVSSEARAKYNVAQKQGNYSRYTGLSFWSPNINIFRDPRWGRGMETYGEDPYLTSMLGSAYVYGLQGRDPFYLKTAACAKHYAVHSGPESTRHEADIHPSEKDLWETYLPAFKQLVQNAGVEIVMAAYNAVNGEACSGSSRLLTDILRNQWQFKGHIVSDCGAVDDIYQGHAIVETPEEASAVAIKAGLNLECGNTFEALNKALEKGLLTESDLDKALLPLMMTRLKLGIVGEDKDCPYNVADESVICSEEHTALARKAAQQSMVLLKNANNTLPLKKETKTIYISGEGATNVFSLMGNYYGLSPRYSTYLEGIVSKVSNGTSVDYRVGFTTSSPELNDLNWAIGDCISAEYTILVMGNNGNMEGEEGEALLNNQRGDRNKLSLPECQLQFLRKVRQEKKSGLIVVLTGGSPIDVSEICELSDAVIMAWYSGQEGGLALGDLVFGDVNFSGRLPITFPTDAEKLPDFEDYSMQGRTYKYMRDNIMFPFGYGLTYSKVEYSNIDIEPVIKKSDTIKVKATLHNQSDCDVDEVAQVYVSTPGAGISAPIESLVDFRRVHLSAGSKMDIEFEISKEKFKTVQNDGSSKLLKGEYTITIGGCAPCSRATELNVSHVSKSFRM